ncbi:MAG: nucleotidyltransferase [Nitrospira sp.]|nr:MAG: nucleotidyltransferase [Nitrospira sp.]
MRRLSQRGTDRKLRRYRDILRRELPKLKARFHIQSLGLFGSYVRGSARQESDLDVLVEFAEEPGLFAFIDCEAYLAALLGVKVDLVMKETLKPRIGRRILSEMVRL